MSLRWWRISPTLVPPSPATCSLHTKLNTQIGKVAIAMVCLAKRVWVNSIPTINTKMKVYQACMLSTLLYGSEGMDSVLLPRMQNQCLPPALPSERFWASPGKTMSQTRMSWLRQENQACLPCLSKGTCALAWSCQPHAG